MADMKISDNQSLLEYSEEFVSRMTAAQENFQANSAARGAVGKHIATLAEQIAAIKADMKKVQNISMQVKLLSFNASIEAARAGAAGRGFAVVATEIGKLSKSTDDAVSSIEENIEAMNAMLQETVDNMNTAKSIGAEFDTRLADCVRCARELNQGVSRTLRDNTK